MKVWMFALRESIRFLVGIEFIVLLTLATAWLARQGLVAPDRETLSRMLGILSVLAVVILPVSVIWVRLDVRKAHRKKVS